MRETVRPYPATGARVIALALALSWWSWMAGPPFGQAGQAGQIGQAGPAGRIGQAGEGGGVPATESPGGNDLGRRAMEHLEAQCALGPRAPGSPGHAQARDYIRRVLEGAGGRVTLQTFRHQAPGLPEPVELTNILARFGPLREGGLLFGAHWDTRPWADRDPDPARREEPILGANDGGSGTGLLLALAESFKADPPPIPILLAFFDGEDLGREAHPDEYLAGSRYFAEHFPGPFPEMGLVVDMVASRTMVLNLEQNSRDLFPEMAMLVDGIAQDVQVDAYDGSWGPALIDDHIPLIQFGLPALCLVDFRDPHWHTHADRPENCSAVNLGATGRVLQALIGGGFFR
ncbi:MAG: M28 family peptidase [Candidatus Eisenbacteria bacterium]